MLSTLLRTFQQKTERVATAALLLGVASLGSRLLGVIRDRLLASYFGASVSLDAYYAAFRWPDTLYNLLIVGALTAGIIPVLSECRAERGEQEAAKVSGSVLSLVALAMMVICIILFLGAPWLVPFTVSGFSTAQIQETIFLTRVMALSPFLLGVSAVMGGVLQTHKRFFAFALAPIFYNLGIIIGIVYLTPARGIRGVAFGVVVGAALHALLQAVSLLGTGFISLKRLHLFDVYIKKILVLMGPRTLGLAIAQLNLLVLLALASMLPEGSVSVLAFAQNVQSVPLGLIGISFAVAALPTLAEAAAKRDTLETTRLVVGLTRQVLVLVIPMAAWLVLLRAQVVRMLLGDGAFDWDDTIRTARLVAWFAISLPAQALVPLLARVWYAHQNAWLPLVIGLVAEGVNISTAFLFRDALGVTGLAIAFSLAACVQAVGLWWFLRRRRLIKPLKPWSDLWKLVCALCLSLAAGYLVRTWVGTIYSLRMAWQVWLQGSLAGLVSLAVYVVVAYNLRLPECRLPLEKGLHKVKGWMKGWRT